MYTFDDTKQLEGREATEQAVEHASAHDGESHATAEHAHLNKKIALKMDIYLLPMVCFIYLLGYLDRANVGNARVAGFTKDIALTDLQYQIGLTVTYIPYMLVEIPSNLLLKIIGPRIQIPLLCTCWGLVATCQSQVHSFGGFIAARFFLGLCEGGLYPGMILYLSTFYRRTELQLRIAFFFTAVSLSGAFSGLLAAAIQQLDGKGGLRGWQWIFLLEGLVTICAGLIAFFLLPNDSSQIRILKPTEKEFQVRRMAQDSNYLAKDPVNLKSALSIFKDPHIMLLMPANMCSATLGIGLAVFGPSIVNSLGYSSTISQLLTVPPYFLAFLATMLTAYLSDRYGVRGLTSFVTGLLCLIGGLIVLKGRSFGVRYTGICIFFTGTYSNAPCLLTWVPNNTAGHGRRATAVAVMAMSTSCGGIISTWIYPTSSAPYYELGAYIDISFICLMEVLIVLELLWLRRLNAIKDKQPEVLLRGLEDLTEEEQFQVLGDHHPRYKYCY